MWPPSTPPRWYWVGGLFCGPYSQYSPQQLLTWASCWCPCCSPEASWELGKEWPFPPSQTCSPSNPSIHTSFLLFAHQLVPHQHPALQSNSWQPRPALLQQAILASSLLQRKNAACLTSPLLPSYDMCLLHTYRSTHAQLSLGVPSLILCCTACSTFSPRPWDRVAACWRSELG